jgi:hypothetical protein
MTRKQLPVSADKSIEQLAKSIEQLVMLLADKAQPERKHEAASLGWSPPPQLVPHLDKLIHHNREHPESRLGAVKIAAWLGRNGVTASKDAVYRWLKKRSRSLQYEMQSTSGIRR